MEFHAIILCGQGKSLSPLVSSNDLTRPKALLPVANKPLLSYPLSWCQKAGFSQISVICLNASLNVIKNYVDQDFLKANPSSVPINVYGVENKHTGDFFKVLAQQIKLDFVILPCDFITNVEPQSIFDVHRNRDANTIITGLYYKNNIETIDKKSILADYTVHTPLSKNHPALLDFYTRQTVNDQKGLHLRKAMLFRHDNAVVSTNLLSTSIYFCSHKVIDILSDSSNHIPFLERSWSKVVRDVARRSWQHREPLENVAFSLIPNDSTFIRVSNPSAYLESNRWIMKEKLRTRDPSAPRPQKGIATVGPDSIVGDESVLGEKTSVKRSNIGSNCNIGKKCRITGCVILDNVTIADDVQLENCLIGSGAKIGLKSRLTGCTVEGGYSVSKDSQAKNEVFEQLTMGDIGDDESYGVYDEDDDDSQYSGSEGEEYSEEEDTNDYGDDDLFDRS
ncbi:hypothetical protein DV451_001620 [Geotrichum candidum]|uniref:Translation initiation factor eIF2B subunit gamma n=1 Tax=Geotrichum candidum TaxID=1173061 RepID=A0A0J9XHY9_GEOCN|nr:hypothetical protein DV451_001620 [Geotrichum candidum]KAF7500968.1 hypothetical protein DV113_000940 [Geotrichum candidum]CDO56563.1 similar to Saccharomyces cerevisiae YOR260W GCD1 Gamma subunit of the translation initiation factor eIF2B,the guanine-nucleotide exchange factor for eIF2 [Geotrichum candidum]